MVLKKLTEFCICCDVYFTVDFFKNVKSLADLSNSIDAYESFVCLVLLYSV